MHKARCHGQFVKIPDGYMSYEDAHNLVEKELKHVNDLHKIAVDQSYRDGAQHASMLCVILFIILIALYIWL